MYLNIYCFIDNTKAIQKKKENPFTNREEKDRNVYEYNPKIHLTNN